MIQRKVIVIEVVLIHQERNHERVKVEDTNDHQGGHVHGQGLDLGPIPDTDVDSLGHIPDLQDDEEADLGHVPILGSHIGGDRIPVLDADQEVGHIPVPDEDQEVGRIPIPDEDQGVGHIPIPDVDLGVGLVPIPVPLHLQRERKAILIINKTCKIIVQSPRVK